MLYDRIPPGRRQRLHRCIGERLETAYAARSAEIAAELVMHFERGGDEPRTIRYLRSVARRSGERGVYTEAIASLRRALALLDRQPDTPERTRDFLRLQLALANFLLLVERYGYPEVEEIYTRCRRLSEEVGDRAQEFLALSGLAWFYFWRARLDEAVSVGQRLVSIAEAAPLPIAALIAHAITGSVQLTRGELALARMHLERALGAKAEQPAFIRPDFITLALTCSTPTLAILGHLDQARVRQRESLEHIHASGSYYDRAVALMRLAQLQCVLGDRLAAAQFAAECMTLASRYGFPEVLIRAQIMALWAHVPEGRKQAVTELDRHVRTLRPDPREAPMLVVPFFFSLNAEAHADVGDVSTALEWSAAASACIEESGERWYEAEAHGLRGEILLAQERRVQRPKSKVQSQRASAEAEGCFQRALEIARAQGAKLFELRAATSLTRLWQAQGKREAARNLLAPVYAWFTEGLDMPELRAAKRLVDDLS